MDGREAGVPEAARGADGFDADVRDAGLRTLAEREAIAREAGRTDAGVDAAASAFPRLGAAAVAGRDVGGRVAPRPAGDRGAPPDGASPGDAPATRGWERPPPRVEGAPAGRGAEACAG